MARGALGSMEVKQLGMATRGPERTLRLSRMRRLIHSAREGGVQGHLPSVTGASAPEGGMVAGFSTIRTIHNKPRTSRTAGGYFLSAPARRSCICNHKKYLQVVGVSSAQEQNGPRQIEMTDGFSRRRVCREK